MFFSGIADEAGKPLAMQIKAHKQLGWQHIEIRNVNETTLAWASDEEFNQIHAELDKAGLQVSCFASQIANWSRDVNGPFEKDVDELKRAIPRMKKMNCPFIRIMSYANKNNIPEADWRKESVRRLREMTKMAEDGGVILVHENCDGWGGHAIRNTLELISEMNSPAFKLVFDTGNPVAHKQNSWEYYAAVKPFIVYIHIKDGLRQPDGKARWFWPGQGDGCVRKIIVDLLHRGYTGGLSIEPHIGAIVHEGKEASPETLFKSYVEYGRRLMRVVSEAEKV